MTQVIGDILLFVLLQTSFWVIGWPIAKLAPAGGFAREMLAPTLGLSVLGICCTAAYRFGAPPPFALVAVLLASASLIIAQRTLFKSSSTPPHLSSSASVLMPILATSAALAVLLLAPKWLGGAAFAAFQGNIFDHFNYISDASSFHHYSFEQITQVAQTAARPGPERSWGSAVHHAAADIWQRPSTPLVYAAFANLTQPTASGAYAFGAALQMNFFFAGTALVGALFPHARYRAVLVGAALSLGFFSQYVFDINAWAQLAGIPIGIAALAALASLFLQMPNSAPSTLEVPPVAWRAATPLAVGLAGLIYLYPEALSICGLALAAMWLTFLLPHLKERKAWLILATTATAVVVAAASSAFYFEGTLSFLLRQMQFATSIDVDWWRYYSAYLLKDDPSGPTLSFLSGALGTYFLRPAADWPTLAKMATSLFLWIWIIALALSIVVTSVRDALHSRRASALMLIAAALAALAIPVYLFESGHFWSAGKGFSMAAPFLFLMLALPIVSPTRLSTEGIFALFLIAAHIGFGIYRPLAAYASRDTGGVLYAAPYPFQLQQELRSLYDWDWSTTASSLRQCQRLSINISNPFVDRYVQLLLTDLGADWSSTAPLQSAVGVSPPMWIQPQIAQPDCIISTNPGTTPEGAKRFAPVSDSIAVRSFINGETDTLELAIVDAPVVVEDGLYAAEAIPEGRLRWTDGTASFVVKNSSRRPARTLTISLWPFRAPNVEQMRVEVNGSIVFAGAPQGNWSREIALEPFADAGTLDIKILSSSAAPAGDGRLLGFPLRAVTLSR